MFDGNCEEAMNYYREKLKGEIKAMMHWDQSPMDVPEEFKKKIMHSQFKFDDCVFMAADILPMNKFTKGNNISLSIAMNDIKKVENWFNSLAEEGKVTMPFQDSFWGAKFGSLTDKYGINWMFHCEMKK